MPGRAHPLPNPRSPELKKTRVYIIDKHALLRRGLIGLINGEADMEVCGEAAHGPAACAAILAARPDVVTTELSSRGDAGIELIQRIRSHEAKINILVISMSDEQVYAPQAYHAGARGFVRKDEGSDRIVKAIRRIHAGHLFFSPSIENALLAAVVRGGNQDGSAVRSLSKRELQIGQLIGGGAGTREIAVQLRVSVKTVETHRSSIKRKLGLPNAARLVQFWASRAAGSGGQC